MRLIDAEKCPCKECISEFNCNNTYCDEFEKWLQKPTYDIDKVMEELEKASYDNSDWGYSAHKDLASYYILRTKDAIEIVKQGVR